MRTLNSKPYDIKLQNSLIRLADVVNFEGPLLTLFENSHNKHLYLLDWVDRDSQFNRWLIYRCTPISLNKFIKKTISHLDLLLSNESCCYTVDIDKNLIWHDLQKIEKRNLPDSYFPEPDVFFEAIECPNLPKLTAIIHQSKITKNEKVAYDD